MVMLPSLLLLFALQLVGASERENFSEKLLLRPLSDGKLDAYFEFKTVWRDSHPRDPFVAGLEDDPLNLNLFPLSLAQILRTYAVSELHLSLNNGKWDYVRWGYPPDSAVRTGAELWAWIGEGGSETVTERWQGLTNSLAGLFCASLGGLDDKRTTSPEYAFRPEGTLPPGIPHKLFHAALPSEVVCTENLTPFIKLLPCKARAGIASLLNPRRIFDADWHGMRVHVRWLEGNEPGEGEVEVTLSVEAVFDPVRLSGDAFKRDWSFRSLFDRVIMRSCPAAETSSVEVDMPLGSHGQLSPESSLLGLGLATYDFTDIRQEVNLAMAWPEPRFEYSSNITRPALTTRRTMKASNPSRGELVVTITNDSDEPRSLLYVETLPWFIHLFAHTLQAEINGVEDRNIIQSLSYVPPISPQPTLLEATLAIPAHSVVRLSISVQNSFIRYTEHQPDASRGWDLPAAVFIPLDDLPPSRLYTPTLLVQLATPDFSMPYNVIIMSSTLVALFFGSVFNLLTRRFVEFKVNDESQEEPGTHVEEADDDDE